jgi:signal peptidase II
MTQLLRCLLVVAVLASCVGSDQASKHLAQAALEASAPRTLLNGAVRLELVRNQGAFLSIGAGLPEPTRYLLFVVFVGTVLLGTLAMALRSTAAPLPRVLALALVTGGGAGNLIDRFAHQGAVVDFVSLQVGPWQTGVFNLADAAISCGVLLLLASAWRQHLVDAPAPAAPTASP